MKLYLALASSFFVSVVTFAQPFEVEDVRKIEEHIESCKNTDMQQRAAGLEQIREFLNSTAKKRTVSNRRIDTIECGPNREVSESPSLVLVQEADSTDEVVKYQISFRKNVIRESKTPEVVDRILKVTYLHMSGENFKKNQSCENKADKSCSDLHKKEFAKCANQNDKQEEYSICTAKALKNLNFCKSHFFVEGCSNLKKPSKEDIVWPVYSESSGDSKSTNKAPSVR